jgi:hypothetical protein
MSEKKTTIMFSLSSLLPLDSRQKVLLQKVANCGYPASQSGTLKSKTFHVALLQYFHFSCWFSVDDSFHFYYHRKFYLTDIVSHLCQ